MPLFKKCLHFLKRGMDIRYLHLLQEPENVLEVVDNEVNDGLAFLGSKHRIVARAGFVAGGVGGFYLEAIDSTWFEVSHHHHMASGVFQV